MKEQERQEFISALKRELAKNCFEHRGRKLLKTGGHHFSSLWVRDFCYGVPGLLQAGLLDLVIDQLSLIAAEFEKAGSLPRLFETQSSARRILTHLYLPWMAQSKHPEHKELFAEHQGEHGTPAFDSGFLFAHAMLELHKVAPQHVNLNLVEAALAQYSQAELNLFQPPFSDWQDSLRREGKISLSHLLYDEAVVRLLKLRPESSLKRVDQTYWDAVWTPQGLWDSANSLRSSPRRSIDVALFWVLFERPQADALWQYLRKSAWTQPFGLCALENENQSSEVSWTTKIIGLSDYHGRMVWSWLLGLWHVVAKHKEDPETIERIEKQMQVMFQYRNTVFEIYEPDRLRPVRRPLYRSESPFSWGIAFWLHGLLS